MHAIIKQQQLVWQQTPEPELKPGCIRIKVHASAVNRADLLQSRGLYPAPPGASEILGLECSGEVIEVAADVDQYQIGQPVCALLAGGGYAEQVVCLAKHALPIPEEIDTVTAAAIPEVFATAWCNLYMEAKLQTQETVLLHAGASGVGSAAIQLCTQMDNPCWVTVGSQQKLEYCQQLGASGGWLRSENNFKTKLSQELPSTGVNVILDPVGAAYFEDNIDCLTLDGRLVLIGLMGGIKSEINLAKIVSKRIKIIGSTLRNRSDDYKTNVINSMYKNLWPLFESKKINPVIEKTYAIQQINEAFELLASNNTIGKIILTVNP